MGFPGTSAGKESICNAGYPSPIPGLGRSPGEGHGNPLHYSCLENPHGQGCLAGCIPGGCKEQNMTERLRAAEHKSNILTIIVARGKEFVDDKLFNLTKRKEKISERQIKKE